jgi:hypothetical protein
MLAWRVSRNYQIELYRSLPKADIPPEGAAPATSKAVDPGEGERIKV